MSTTSGLDAVLARQRSRRQINRRIAAGFIVLLIILIMSVGCDGSGGSLAQPDAGSPAMLPPSSASLSAASLSVTIPELKASEHVGQPSIL